MGAPRFCPDAVHHALKRHPRGLVNLRPWPGTGFEIGECPHCWTSLMVPAGWAERQAVSP